DPSVIPLAWEALEEARRLGDRRSEGRALQQTGGWAWAGGPANDGHLESSIAIAREVGDQWGLAMALAALGTAHGVAGGGPAAAAVLEEALEACRDLGDRYIANTVRYNLARALTSLGRTQESEAMLHDVIAHARNTGDRFSLSMALADLGFLRALQGDIDDGLPYVDED